MGEILIRKTQAKHTACEGMTLTETIVHVHVPVRLHVVRQCVIKKQTEHILRKHSELLNKHTALKCPEY